MHTIREVTGADHADIIHRFNRMAPDIFPELQPRHIEDGYWWLAYLKQEPVGFAGLVPFEPFPNVGYLKRAYVLPEHRGHGLQQRFLFLREAKAKQLGWSLLVSECANGGRSSHNFARAGYSPCDPEQPWGTPNSIYWAKQI